MTQQLFLFIVVNMFTRFPKDIYIISFAFLLLFCGFSGAQQYITIFFSEFGQPRVGFQSLLLIYICFAIANPLSASLVSRLGPKRSMIIGAIFYVLFIVSLAAGSVPLVYISSILIGIAASFVWTGNNSYILRISQGTSYGANAGLFSTLFSLGAAGGVLLFGAFIVRFSFNQSFLLAALFSIL